MKFGEELLNAIKTKSEIGLRDLNDRMVNVEKSFVYGVRLPYQKFNHHVIFAPPFNNKFATGHFPGIFDIMIVKDKTEKHWEEMRRQVSILSKSIMSAFHLCKTA